MAPNAPPPVQAQAPATIGWDDFLRVELRVGRILRAEAFPEARKPAYKLWIDFGPEIGQRKSSAQITAHYTPEALVGKLVLAVLNFPPRQIGPFMSECLVTGLHDVQGAVTLCVPEHAVAPGTRLLQQAAPRRPAGCGIMAARSTAHPPT